MRRPRVVLADEHGLFLEGVQCILGPEFEVVGWAHDGRALIDLVSKLQPDIVLTEVTLPLLNGIEATIRIKKKTPRARILFVTRHTERQQLTDALRAGASGYLLKSCPGSELLTAIREVLHERSYITPLMTADLFSSFREAIHEGSSPTLTERQREILQLVAEGHSLKDISAILNISTKTVEYHKYSLMRVLGLRTNSQLIRYAIATGPAASVTKEKRAVELHRRAGKKKL